MARKLFIVARDQPEILASLRRAIGSEPGVEIFHDRRLPGKAASREQVERRERPDIDAELRERGFAVVHVAAASIRAKPVGRFRF